MDINIDPAINGQQQQQNRSISEKDLKDAMVLRDEPYDYEYIVDATSQFLSDQNTLYSGVDARFRVEKYVTSEIILTKDGQLLNEEEVQLVLANLDLFQTRDTDGNYPYYYLVDDNQNRDSKKLNEIRLRSPALLDLLKRVGTIIVAHINNCTSVVVGGRVRLEEKGYWFMKRGSRIEFILNDYAEGEVPEIDALAGDTFFFFGAEIDSPIVGNHWFSCAIDSHFNFCWNNEIIFNIPEMIQEGGRWLWNEAKLIYHYISNKIWSLFSRNNNANTNTNVVEDNNNNRKNNSIVYKCPGFTFYPNMDEELIFRQLQMEVDD